MKKSEAKKDRKRKKIFLAIIMIMFTGLILTASTYAWFTANRTVTVDAIDVNVSTSQGLQISTDAQNWKSVVTNDDITGAAWSGVTNQLPATATNPVSSVGTVDSNGFMEMYQGSISTDSGTGNNVLTADKSTETNGTTGHFVAFDLFFQSNKDRDVYLTSNSGVIAKGTSTGIENATRVAFIVEGYAAYGSQPSVAQALKGNNEMLIWEPNFDVHTASGVSNASNIYGITVGQTGGSKLNYVGVKAAISSANAQLLNSQDAQYFGSVTTTGTPSSGIPESAYLKSFNIHEGVTKVRIYMWVEGQDVDCEDHASGGSITYNLQFSINSNVNDTSD